MRFAISPLLLTLALGAPAAIAATDMYRSVLPDGSVRYGESPERGAKSVKRIPPPPVSTGTITVTEEEKGRVGEAGQTGGVTVLPTQPRPSPQPAEQGRLHAPSDGALPARPY
jgi:hypothetical protein